MFGARLQVRVAVSVTFEKMLNSVCMAANCSLPRVENRVGVECKRASANVRAAVVAALVELPAGMGKSCEKKSTVLVMHSARVSGM